MARSKKLTRKEKAQQLEQAPAPKRAEKTSNNNRSLNYTLAAIVAVFGIILYSNTANHGYVLDDLSVVSENRIVKQGAAGIGEIFQTSYRKGYKNWTGAGSLYRPLTLTVFAITWQISPGSSSFAHLINILLYGLLCAVLLLTLLQLFHRYNPLLAFLTTLLFVAHPIHTEVVANIKSLDEMLALLFALFSLRLLLSHCDQAQIWKPLLALLFFNLAFFAKESTITFVVLIPLVFYFFRKPEQKTWLTLAGVLLIPTILYLYARYAVLSDLSGHGNVAQIDNLLLQSKDFMVQKTTAIKILGLYLWKLLLPHPLANDYSLNQITLSSLSDWKFLVSALIYLALLVEGIRGLFKKQIHAFAILLFLVSIALYSNLFITIGSSFGERFLFVPSLGFCLVIAWAVVNLLKIDLQTPVQKLAALFKGKALYAMLILAPILLLYSFKTMDRNMAWESNLSLYETDVKTSSNSARSHYYYGLELMKTKAKEAESPQLRERFLNEALNEFKEAINIYPGYAGAYEQVGLAAYRKGDYQQAEQYLTEALRRKPNAPTINSNLGIVYFATGRLNEALPLFEKSISINPYYADAFLNMGSTLGTMQRFPEAINAFLKSAELDPSNAEVYRFISMTYQNMEQMENAQRYMAKYQQMQRASKQN